MFEAVRRDLEAREWAGFRVHGKPMRFDDPGRDWLQEAYEELLDGAMYLKAQMMLRASQEGTPTAAAAEAPRRELHRRAQWWAVTWLVACGVLVNGIWTVEAMRWLFSLVWR